jgi:hypothetical protein
MWALSEIASDTSVKWIVHFYEINVQRFSLGALLPHSCKDPTKKLARDNLLFKRPKEDPVPPFSKNTNLTS